MVYGRSRLLVETFFVQILRMPCKLVLELIQTNMDKETAYNNLVTWHETHKMTKGKRTGVQKVVQYMLDNRSTIWFWSYDFVGKVNHKGEFLSHRSPARASDLAIHYPELVEERKIGRLSVYRLRVENMDDIINFLNSTYEK